MKVVFLDFDGVLNSQKFIRSSDAGVILNPESMKILKYVVDKTGAKIVLSSSWREHWNKDNELCDFVGAYINSEFKKAGLEIFDKTPQERMDREEQIEKWLKENPDTSNFVVLDDAFLDAKFLRGHFVRTSEFRGGIDMENANEAISILNKGGAEAL